LVHLKEFAPHIQLLCKEQRDGKRKMKSFKEGELILWMPKPTKIKGNNLTLPWKGPFFFKNV
jgi:hypothetical protein